MEWTNNACIELIEAYRKQTMLWDPKHPNHYSKVEKGKAWKVIAQQLNTDVEEVKKKMCSLLGSFRREKSKEKRSVLWSKGGKSIYTSRWFAYESMSFLLNREVKPEILDMESVDIDEGDTYTPKENEELSFDSHCVDESVVQIQLDDDLEDDYIQQASSDSFHLPQIPKLKRQRLSREDPLCIKRCMSSTGWPTDDCGVYGQHIANKLRKYKSKARAMVEHAINNIIFEADMGRYDSVDYQPGNSSSNIWNPSVSPDRTEQSDDTSLQRNLLEEM